MTAWPPTGIPLVPRGVPVNTISLADGYTVLIELSSPEGRIERATVAMDPTAWAIPGGHPSAEFTRLIEDRYGHGARKSVLEAVFAFWYAARPDPDPPPGPTPPPRLRRLAVLAPDRFELTVDDGRRFLLTVGADGTIVSAAPALAEAGEPALVAGAVAELHATRTLGDAGLSHRRPKQTRSVAEAGAYLLSLLPPRERSYDWRSAMQVVFVEASDAPGEAWVRFERPADAGVTRADVHVPAGFDHSSPADRYLSHGVGRSTVLDAGQWLDLERRQAALAADLAQEVGGHELSARTYDAVLHALRHAAAAADELAKLLPPDADVVPDDAFWTAESRHRRATWPELFHRARIEEARARYRDAIDEHIDRRRPGAFRESPEAS